MEYGGREIKEVFKGSKGRSKSVTAEAINTAIVRCLCDMILYGEHIKGVSLVVLEGVL